MSKKLTREEFVERACKKHHNKYDYSNIDYKDSITKIIIICKEHGSFCQRPSNHLSKSGCPKCSYKIRNEKLKYNTDVFIKKANAIHNFMYTYDKVDYKGNNIKVIITCKVHGDFEQIPSSHLQKYGCSKCSNNYQSNTIEFIEKANKIHNFKYTYNKTNYISRGKKNNYHLLSTW
jgi:hypothetical protein